MNTRDEIRLTLIDLMENHGVNGNELAEAVGVTKQSVSQWRTGKSSIDIENVPAICRFFGITIDDFFGSGKEKPAKPLTNDERELIEFFRNADDEGKRTILNVARAMPKETK